MNIQRNNANRKQLRKKENSSEAWKIKKKIMKENLRDKKKKKKKKTDLRINKAS